MAGKSSQVLETVLSVVDRASDRIKRVERDAKALEDIDPEVDISADDNASDELKDIRGRLERLDGEDAAVIVKSEVKKAKADIRSLERRLVNIDDEEVEAEITADISQARARLGALNDELDALGGQGEQAGADMGGGIASGLKAAGAAAAIGAALVSTVGAGIERIQIRARFRNQFGLVKEDAERLGKEAADVYADGWGESLSQVQTSLGLIQQQLVETGAVGSAETDEIAESALAMSDVFGVDVSEIIRSVGQLLKNGLAPDATAALDIVTGGFQGGADTAGDFLETIDEYSQHFAAFGLSGQDATDIIIAGFQGGQRDADKLADAVKEMRIRTVEDSDAVSAAYAELGVDADDFRGRILEGGPAARQAFREIIAELKAVEDPVRQQALAVELIGTQYEDLGPGALDALGAITGATKDASGATEDLVESMGEATSEAEMLKRRATDAFGTFAEGVATVANEMISDLAGTADEITNIEDVFADLEDGAFESFGEASKAVEALGLDAATTEKVLRKYADANDQVYTTTRDTSRAMVQASIDAGLEEKALEDAARATEAKAEADEDAERSAEDHAEAMEEQRQAAEDLTEQLAALVGGSLGVERSQIRAREAAAAYDLALQGVDEEGNEVVRTEDQMRLAFIDATEAQLAAAEAAADHEIAQREANGEVLTAQGRNDILAEKLRNVAGTLAPGSPLRRELDGYADDLDDIPANVNTTLTASTAWGTVAGWIGQLNSIPSRKNTHLTTTGGNIGRRARGGPVMAGEPYVVGEEGPELVTPGTSGFVHDANKTADMLGGGGVDRQTLTDSFRDALAESGRGGAALHVAGDMHLHNEVEVETVMRRLNMAMMT